MIFINPRTKLWLVVCVLITITGCSGGGTGPVAPVGQHPQEPVTERDTCSERMLWGIWEIEYDPVEMEAVVLPARHLLGHYNITQYVLPPACDDCFNIAVQGFDPVTRILDADVTLRNPMPISGHDVRGILYTNDYGHELTNADAWTGLWEIPGGMELNPFKAFAKGTVNRIFSAGAEHTGKYVLYVPDPANYWALTFAVDASFPDNCKEPYEITNFWQEEIDELIGSQGSITVDVYDWQENVSEVTLEAPEIIGWPAIPFAHITGNTWGLEITNSQGADWGDYEALCYWKNTYILNKYKK